MIFKLPIICLLSLGILLLFPLPCEASGRVLEIHDLKLNPNPFSPYSTYIGNGTENGLRISFRVETLSRFFWLTANVYNLNGRLVRTITEELEPKYADGGDKSAERDIEIWWDGKDNYGSLANNGRYLIHIKISDTEAQTFSTEKIKTVVLVK